jgi:pantothenate kinase
MSAQLTSPDGVALSVAELVDRARRLASTGGRRLLGITGAPGAGKTTLARTLAAELGPQLCVLVPMDGFHLSNATLISWGRRDRKGAWDTFDVDGYLHLLRRLRERTDEIVHAPDFDRDVDESIGSAIPVHRDVPLVVAEGNYLLSSEGAWPKVAALLDESWFLDLDDPTRQERLVTRHEQHGMSHQQAVDWTAGTDQANAVLVAAGRERADLAVTVVTP